MRGSHPLRDQLPGEHTGAHVFRLQILQILIETSTPSLATKWVYTTHAAWGVVAKLPG